MNYVVMVNMMNGNDMMDFPVYSTISQRNAELLAKKINETIDKVGRGLARQNLKKQAARKKVWNVVTTNAEHCEPFSAYVVSLSDSFEKELDAALAEFEALK